MLDRFCKVCKISVSLDRYFANEVDVRLFRRSKPSRILQQNNRNVTAFRTLLGCGFSPAQARKMLIAGNNIYVNRLAAGVDVSAATIHRAILGSQRNLKGQAIIAAALHIPIEELFPEQDTASKAA